MIFNSRLMILSMCFTFTSMQAQYIQFNDIHFKTLLVNDPLINTNGDGEIQKFEAGSYTGSLVLNNAGIYDLEGIQHFKEVKHLNISNNVLVEVDLSANTKLERLICRNNLLTALEVNVLSELKVLDCSNNQISQLDVMNNYSLHTLRCSDNDLEDLDVYNNLDLITLDCSRNMIQALDVSENPSLQVLYCANNGMHALNVANSNNQLMSDKNIDFRNNNLNCIEVDNASYSNHNWTKSKDNNAYYSVDCSSFSSPSNASDGFELNVFPNPTTDNININLGSILKDVDLEIISNTGAIVMKQVYDEADFINLDLDLVPGMYMVNVKVGTTKQETIKLIVQ